VRAAHAPIVVHRWTATNPTRLALLAHGYGEHAGRYAHVAEGLGAGGAVREEQDVVARGDKRGRLPAEAHHRALEPSGTLGDGPGRVERVRLEDVVIDLTQLRKLVPLADDAAFRAGHRKATRDAKVRFAAWLKSATGQVVDPDSIFDTQVKRIHEYKRQLLNLLHIVILYNRLRQNPKYDAPPRTFFFAGKAAPGYHRAKRIIRLAHDVARVIKGEPKVGGLPEGGFLPNFNVSLAEAIIPAAIDFEEITRARADLPLLADLEMRLPHLLGSLHAARRERGDAGKRGSGPVVDGQGSASPSVRRR